MTDSKKSKFELQELRTSKGSASGDQLFNLGNNADFANSIYDKDKNAITNLVGENVKAFIFSKDGEDKKISDGNLKTVVLIDEDKHSVVVVTAGTRISGNFNDMIADVRDDLLLSFGFQPKKKQEVQSLNDLVLEKIPAGDLAKYKFHYTGHSLGAVMSDIAATNMAHKLAKKGIPVSEKISTVTFDNPGSYTLVNKMLKRYKKDAIEKENESYYRTQQKNPNNQAFHEKNLEDINKLKLKDFVDYKSFNNRPNAINTADKQAGKLYTIVPDDQKERNLFFRMIGYLADKMPGIVVKKILTLIPFGSPAEQVKEHGVDNFIEVLKKENGTILYHDKSGKTDVTILDIMHNTKPLEVKENKEVIFKKLKAIHETSKDQSVEFSMSIDVKKESPHDEYAPESASLLKKGSEIIEVSRKDIAELVAQANVEIPESLRKDLASHLRYDHGSYTPPPKKDPALIKPKKGSIKPYRIT